MSIEDRSVACTITWRHDWAPHLFSFRTTRPAGMAFAPGQFVRLGIVGFDGIPVFRAYSIASSPTDDEFEFYSIIVPAGPFTQPLARLRVDDEIRIDPTVYGFLRSDRFADGRDLWLLATGTGVAPFRSMIADDAVWARFDEIVLVHSVRRRCELAYHDEFHAAATASRPRGARLRYLPTLTVDDDPNPAWAQGRITTLLADGTLEGRLELPLSVDRSRLMICGNPSMIKETRALLGARGMTPVRRETPGQFIVENFW